MKVFKVIVLLILSTAILLISSGILKESRKSTKSINSVKAINSSNDPVLCKSNKNGKSDNYGKSNKTDKVLIVYFSLTGNTRKVADIIQDNCKGEIFAIKPDFDYSAVKSRSEMEELGNEQVESNFKPKLINAVKDFDSYDLIIVGSPVWWYNVTPPVMSFLSEYDFKGKKVAPFCTCGSDPGDFFTQFEDAIPEAKVQKGLILTEAELSDESKMKKKINKWMKDFY